MAAFEKKIKRKWFSNASGYLYCNKKEEHVWGFRNNKW